MSIDITNIPQVLSPIYFYLPISLIYFASNKHKQKKNHNTTVELCADNNKRKIKAKKQSGRKSYEESLRF